MLKDRGGWGFSSPSRGEEVEVEPAKAKGRRWREVEGVKVWLMAGRPEEMIAWDQWQEKVLVIIRLRDRKGKSEETKMVEVVMLTEEGSFAREVVNKLAKGEQCKNVKELLKKLKIALRDEDPYCGWMVRFAKWKIKMKGEERAERYASRLVEMLASYEKDRFEEFELLGEKEQGLVLSYLRAQEDEGEHRLGREMTAVAREFVRRFGEVGQKFQRVQEREAKRLALLRDGCALRRADLGEDYEGDEGAEKAAAELAKLMEDVEVKEKSMASLVKIHTAVEKAVAACDAKLERLVEQFVLEEARVAAREQSGRGAVGVVEVESDKVGMELLAEYSFDALESRSGTEIRASASGRQDGGEAFCGRA